jgi:hypothetical protein
MMPTRVSIPQPCNENFAAMPQCEKGLYCGVCKKHLVDLRNKKLHEVNAALEKYTEACIVVDSRYVKEKRSWKWADRSVIWLRKYRLSGIAAVLLGISLLISSCHHRRRMVTGGYFKQDTGQRTEMQNHE